MDQLCAQAVPHYDDVLDAGPGLIALHEPIQDFKRGNGRADRGSAMAPVVSLEDQQVPFGFFGLGDDVFI